MNDLLYIAGTVTFFVLMFGYVAACEALGRRSTREEKP